MKIEKAKITTDPLIKTAELGDKQDMYVISESEFGSTKLLTEEELQQLYEYRRHQIACEYVADMYAQFTDEELGDSQISEVAREMQSLTEKEGLTDFEALEKIFEMRAERLASPSDPKLEKVDSKIKLVCELVRDFDGTYYANISVDGNRVSDLPENIDYRTLKKAIKEQYRVELPLVKDLVFQRIGRKSHATFIREE